MRGWGFRTFAVLSLMVAVSAVGAWGIGWRHSYGVVLHHHWWHVGLMTSDGWVCGYRGQGVKWNSGWEWMALSTRRYSAAEFCANFGAARLGFGYLYHQGAPFRSGYVPFRIAGLLVPLWLIVLFCALPVWMWLRRAVLLRTRLRRGLCWRCGYDLRASGGRCPECGTVCSEEPGAFHHKLARSGAAHRSRMK